MDSARIARIAQRIGRVQIIPYNAAYREQTMALGREMHLNSIYQDLPFDEAKTERQISACNVDVPDWYFKLAVRDDMVLGAMMGSIHRSFFCDALLARDTGWWVFQDHRGQGAAIKLLADFEQWARAQGACKVMIGQVTERNIEQTTKLYTHLGFRVVGFNTVKDL